MVIGTDVAVSVSSGSYYFTTGALSVVYIGAPDFPKLLFVVPNQGLWTHTPETSCMPQQWRPSKGARCKTAPTCFGPRGTILQREDQGSRNPKWRDLDRLQVAGVALQGFT